MAQIKHQTDNAVPALLRLGEALREADYHFITITPASHAIVNRRKGNEWAKSLHDVFGWSRPFRNDVVPRHLLDAMRDAGVVEPFEDGWRSLVRLSTLDGSLFIHSAFPTVARNAVFFGPDTYKFVAAIKAHLASHREPVRRAVDICSGAGPGAVTIARAYPEAEVLMADINDEALQIADVNASLAGLNNLSACKSDILSGVDGEFDLIVAHPPYLVDRGARAYRHGGGPLGADLSLAIARAALERLAPGGSLVLFTGIAMVNNSDPFHAEISVMLERPDFDWHYHEVDPDVFGEELDYPPYDQADRIALTVLTATKRARSGMRE